MYALFSKSLESGIVSAFIEADWDVLKARIIKHDTVSEAEWDSVRAWDKLYNGYVLNDGAQLWCYWDESRPKSFGADLFTGTVSFFSDCEN